MKKYIITIPEKKDFTAASKARDDAETIAVKQGYIPFSFKGERSAERNPLTALKLIGTTLQNWNKLTHTAEPGSIVLLQYPHYPLKTAFLIRRKIQTIRKRKNIRFVFLVHDLNSVRGTMGRGAVYSDNYLLKQADRIICHNNSMRELLTKKGIPEEKLISLQIFDYLTDAKPGDHRLQDGIAIAGNLSPDKCGYVRDFIRIADGKIPVHLYGKGYEEETGQENVFYHGAVSSAELPGVIRGCFGLVWDGPSAESCSGKMGEYLRINNPHKLSLYLASGMPAILWKEAAEAGFVEENSAGRTVGSLEELVSLVQQITEQEYREMLHHIQRIAERLREGSYLSSALQKVEQEENSLRIQVEKFPHY